VSHDAVLIENVHLKLGSGAARVHVLRGISVNVTAGEAVGIVGPSGSGKSTLLMVMAGLERPDSGRVVVAGQDLGALDEDGLARFRGQNVGIVFQSFHLIQNMTALENVSVPLELAGHDDAFARAEVALERIGLADRMDHYPAEMSGGEQQRVALARALVVEPAILFADEPTGNLDGRTGHQIIDLMFALQEERGATLVLVTHDLEMAGRCARTISLNDGVVEAGERQPARVVAG
jgi:putative ABC transport system ATP-binding protein